MSEMRVATGSGGGGGGGGGVDGGVMPPAAAPDMAIIKLCRLQAGEQHLQETRSTGP